MIPRGIACRIWAACCEREARRLRALTSADALRSARRRAGAAGEAGAEAKAADRRVEAEGHERSAAVLSRWGAGRGPRGGDLAPEIVGLVAAAIHRHTPAIDELRSRTGAPAFHGAAGLIPFIRWILERPA